MKKIEQAGNTLPEKNDKSKLTSAVVLWSAQPEAPPCSHRNISAYSLLVCSTVDQMEIRKLLKNFSIYKWISEISKCIADKDVV